MFKTVIAKYKEENKGMLVQVNIVQSSNPKAQASTLLRIQKNNIVKRFFNRTFQKTNMKDFSKALSLGEGISTITVETFLEKAEELLEVA